MSATVVQACAAPVRTRIQVAVDVKIGQVGQAPSWTGCVLLSKELWKGVIEETCYQLHAGVHGRKLPFR